MANIEFSGVSSLARQLTLMERGVDEMEDEILKEGAEIIKKEWKNEMERAGHRDTGRLISAVKAQKVKTNKSGYKYVDVYPSGTYPDKFDGKGKRVRLGMVAAVLHYGRSDLEGSRFVTKAEKASEKKLQGLCDKKNKQFIREKGLN